MKYIILNNTTSSSIISPSKYQGFQLESVQMDTPLNEMSQSEQNVVISGATTGAYTFNNDQKIRMKFARNEDVYLSAYNLSGSYQAIIGYNYYGDQSALLEIEQRQRTRVPLANRFSRTDP